MPSGTFEPWVGGRFVAVHDAESGEGTELGRIEAWEPGSRLLFTWRQPNWDADELTRVEVLFEPEAAGTRVTLRHFGFEAIRSEVGCDVGYAHGWRELLDGYAGVGGAVPVS